MARLGRFYGFTHVEEWTADNEKERRRSSTSSARPKKPEPRPPEAQRPGAANNKPAQQS
jgi:hypothetical protein